MNGHSLRKSFAILAVAMPALALAASAADIAGNGEFDQGKEGWRSVNYGNAEVEFEIDKEGKLSGANAARLRVIANSDKVYHLRLVQPFGAVKDAEYALRLTMAADAPIKVRLGLQASSKPHDVVAMKVVSVGAEPKEFEITGVNKFRDMDCFMQVDFGDQPAGRTLWVDKVSLMEKR